MTNGNGNIQKIVLGAITTVFAAGVIALMNALWSTGVRVGKAEGRLSAVEARVSVNYNDIKDMENKIDEIYRYVKTKD